MYSSVASLFLGGRVPARRTCVSPCIACTPTYEFIPHIGHTPIHILLHVPANMHTYKRTSSPSLKNTHVIVTTAGSARPANKNRKKEQHKYVHRQTHTNTQTAQTGIRASIYTVRHATGTRRTVRVCIDSSIKQHCTILSIAIPTVFLSLALFQPTLVLCTRERVFVSAMHSGSGNSNIKMCAKRKLSR